EVLLAVDHPGVAVAHGPAAELPRVGAALWLGHGEAGDDVAVEERLEVLPLLLLGPVVREDLRVARVGGLAAEDVRRPHRPAEDLVQQRELHLAVARAAELGAEMAGPEAVLPHLCLQRIGNLLVHRVPPVARRAPCPSRSWTRTATSASRPTSGPPASRRPSASVPSGSAGIRTPASTRPGSRTGASRTAGWSASATPAPRSRTSGADGATWTAIRPASTRASGSRSSTPRGSTPPFSIPAWRSASPP